MELLYYWMDDDITLNQTGFHLSDRFQFQLIENRVGFELEIKKNPAFIEKFFGKNISNITAIVGQNGAGKSTLLYSIIERITGHQYIYGHQFIMAFYTGKKIMVYESFTNNGGHVIEVKGEKAELIEVEKYHNLPGDPINDIDILKKSSLIYYNPIYDFKDYPFDIETRPFSDISSTYLQWADKEKFVTNEYVKYDMVALHRSEEIKRQLDFINQSILRIKNEPFEYPDELEVEVLRFEEIDKSDLGFNARRILEILRKTASLIFQKHNDLIHDKSELQKREKSKSWLFTNLLCYFFLQLEQRKDLDDKLTGCTINDLEGFDRYDPAFEEDELKMEKFLQSVSINEYQEAILQFFAKQQFIDGKALLEYFEYLINIVDSKSKSISDNSAAFSLSVLDAQEFLVTLESINDLMISEPRIVTRNGLTRIKWRNMSSGELSFLNLYSRLYYAITDLLSRNRDTEFIYLLIDEGDVGLHPQWQKELVKNCIEFLRGASNLKFQIILTSHSPIILSDIPSSKVLLLDKSEGKTVLLENEKSETFGANIHSLFRDSFFVKNGLIGGFASEKIKSIIGRVEEFNPDINDYDELLELVKLIGEPILRNTLEDRLSSLASDERRIELLQQEIDRLKNREGDKD